MLQIQFHIQYTQKFFKCKSFLVFFWQDNHTLNPSLPINRNLHLFREGLSLLLFSTLLGGDGRRPERVEKALWDAVINYKYLLILGDENIVILYYLHISILFSQFHQETDSHNDSKNFSTSCRQPNPLTTKEVWDSENHR